MKRLCIVLVLFSTFIVLSCPNPNEPIPDPLPDPIVPNISFSLNGAPTISFTSGPTDLVMDQPNMPFISIYEPASSGDNNLYLYASAEGHIFCHATNTSYDYCRIWIATGATSYSGTYASMVSILLVLDGTSYLSSTNTDTLTILDVVDLSPDGSIIKGSFQGNLGGFSISGTFSLPHQAVDLSVYDS